MLTYVINVYQFNHKYVQKFLKPLLQFNIQITDNGIPPLTAVSQAVVTIEILRNQFDPIFAGPFEETVNENAPIGQSVIKVSANDQDGTVSEI